MLLEIIDTPFFGIGLSITMYLIATFIYEKTKFVLFNPLLVASILTIGFLSATGITYEQYSKGGDYITFFIAPATISMVINLYKNIEVLKKNIVPVFVGIFAGVITAVVSTIFLSKALNLNEEILYSLIPKSLTTPIGVAISEQYGGIKILTVVAIIITGIIGAVIAPTLMKIIGVDDPVAQGVGIGTSTHAVGTSRAIQMGEIQGSMSGLSIALAGFMSVVVIPILVDVML